MSETTQQTSGLTYKGRPLRRVDNVIYYGTMSEKFIVMMQILESKQESDLDVATRVAIQLQQTDPGVKFNERIVKKSEKTSLYSALELSSIWLERALSGK